MLGETKVSQIFELNIFPPSNLIFQFIFLIFQRIFKALANPPRDFPPSVFHESNPSIRIWFWFRQDVQSQSINPLYIYTGMSYLFFPARCVLQRNFRFWLRGVMHTTEFDSMVCRTPCSLRGIMHIKNRDSALWCAKDSRTIEHSSSHKIS